VSLNTAVPWDVEMIGGSNKFQGKFSALDLRSFELTGGVDQLRLTLGRPTGVVPIRLIGGANHARFERPAGVPIQLRISGAAGRIESDHQKLGGTAGPSLLESAGAATANDRFVIDVGAVSRIAVVEIGD
jgi:hypothetical protein